ncbi:BlaI/MecI/CopY family transcriptional regulator [Alkaliphilus crotonatoxidans]
MSKLQRISEAEMEVMQVIWASEEGITAAEILQKLNQEKDWKPTTVFTFLSRLVEKGVLKAVKQGKAKRYIPLMSEGEYKCLEARTYLDRVHNGSIGSFITALYEGDGISQEEIEELRKILLKGR